MKLRVHWWVPTVVAAAVLLGCPKSNPSTDAGVPLDFVGRACNVDAECGDLRCDKQRHQCICLSDESCRGAAEDPVRYCNNYTGLCVTEIVGCTADSQCPTSDFCDSSIRSCRPRKGFCERCSASRECGGEKDDCILDPSGELFCSRACLTSADCPRGAACVSTDAGQLECHPAPNPLAPTETPTCKNFRGCTPDSLRTCNSNADCDAIAGQRCDPAKGRCVALEQVCPFGTVCDPRNKICVAECAADIDCGDPKLRCVNRLCEPVGECTKDDQCPINKICSIIPGQPAGQCLPYCRVDDDCPIGSICQRGVDNRYRCITGCTTNAGCPVDKRCNTTTRVCEGPVLGDVRTCQATAVCKSCELCDATSSQCFSAKGTFPFCRTCSTPGDCPGGACVQMDDGASYCAKYCGTGQECPQGFVCLPLTGTASMSACVPSNRQCKDKCL